MAKVLVVEDYEPMASALEDWLTHERHVVEVVANGDEALNRLRVYKYDVVALDLNLPGLNGLEVCRQFRARGGTTPILILTGQGTVEDKETGLDTGADDYLVKPFEFKELSARIRALLRRTASEKTNVLTAGPLVLDLRSHKAMKRGQEIHLSPTELSLLEFFMRHPNQFFTSEALLDRVWRSTAMTSLDTVRSYIRILRRKIDTQEQGSFISTGHGSGYMFEIPS